MTTTLTREEYQRIKDIKILDLQWCDFCQRINILNLGWKPFGKFYCRLHEAEYVVCWELCYKVCCNIWGCQLYRAVQETPWKPVKPNKPYDYCSCYLCSKELKGAGKTGVIKNRNNPSFWGLSIEYKILCLKCLGKRYLNQLSGSKRKTYFKYLKRGYE